MTTGEGGMVTTHSEEEWLLLRSLRNQGRGDAGGWLEHVRLGFNYRMSDISAALGLGQVEKLDEILALRAAVAKRYDELLGGIDGVEIPCADDDDHKRSWFVYVVKLPDNEARERVIAHFEREAIGYNRYLPVDPSAAVHARALRIRRRPVPGVGGHQLAHARAPVLHRARGATRRSGSPKRLRRRSDEADVGRGRRGVRDEGRFDDPRAASHGGAEPRRGDARGGAGDRAPLPPRERRRSTSC